MPRRRAQFMYEVPLPDGVDPTVVAAAMDAVMHTPARWSWPVSENTRFREVFPSGWTGAAVRLQSVRRAAEPLAMRLLVRARLNGNGPPPSVEDGTARSLSVGETECQAGSAGVVVSSFSSGDPAAAAAVTAAVIGEFRQSPLRFEWAESTVPPKRDGFGGGVAFCSEDGVVLHDTASIEMPKEMEGPAEVRRRAPAPTGP